MNSLPATRFIAADIGNARIKLGLFAGDCSTALPEPVQTLPLWGDEPELDQIESWLAAEECRRHTPCAAPLPVDGVCGLQWWIASVNRPAAARLIGWIEEHRLADRVTLLTAGDLPLAVRLERPDLVGIDRLVDAVAANRLRRPDRAAVVVDVGTAITVDLISADGAFLGGAILPGPQIAADALHASTDLLPPVDVEWTEPPPALGTATASAIRSGVFWGAVGAIRELIDQFQKAAATPTAAHCKTASGDPSLQIFLTGGAGAVMAEWLGRDACYLPNLTLSGVALAAQCRIK